MFNITRPSEVPGSLLRDHPEYNAQDVIEALEGMSYSKCYICETKNPLSINVEHFDATGGRHDWNNLFLSCGRCNSNIKGSRYNNLLNPCDPGIDVVRAVKHEMPRSPNTNINIMKVMDIDGADQTVELLDKVFNSDDTGNRAVTRAFLRKKIFFVASKFYSTLTKYWDDNTPDRQKRECEEQLIHYLRSDQEYSAFIRWVVLEDEDLRPIFEQYID